VKPDFLSQHKEISNDVRSIVVDWMVEVQETLELNHETLYLGVKNMDLFLSEPKNKDKLNSFPVKRSKLRLLACASLLLAAQYDVSYYSLRLIL
jgi:G2/mitotic-specific cyclin-B3